MHVFLFTSGDGKQVNSKMETHNTSRLFLISEKIGQPRNLIDQQYDPTIKTTLNGDSFVPAPKNDFSNHLHRNQLDPKKKPGCVVFWFLSIMDLTGFQSPLVKI